MDLFSQEFFHGLRSSNVVLLERFRVLIGGLFCRSGFVAFDGQDAYLAVDVGVYGLPLYRAIVRVVNPRDLPAVGR